MKLNFLHGALALGLAALMAACSGGSKPDTDSEWFTYADEDGENYGFFNPGTGKTMYAEEFSTPPTCIVDGLFIVKESDGVAVYSVGNGKTPKVLGDLEELKGAGGVAQGMLPVVRPGSRIEVYSVSPSKAELAFTLDPIDGKEITLCRAYFADGLLVAQNEDDMYGAVDKSGQVVIPFEYHTLHTPSNGILIAGKSVNGADKWYALNAKGEELFKFKKDIVPYSARISDQGYIICRNSDNRRYVLATSKGEYINMPKSVEGIADMHGQYAVFEKDSQYGILKINGEETETVVKAKYKILKLLPWDPAKFFSSKDGEEFFVSDLDGNKLFDFSDDYDGILPYTTPNWEGFIGWEGHEYTFFNKKGEKIKYPDAHEIYYLSASTFNNILVVSDCFNLSEFVSQVSNAVSLDGLCGYLLGEYANKYYPSDLDPKRNTASYWFTPSEQPDIKGYKYSSSLSLRTQNYISIFTMDTDYNSHYNVIRDNPIDGMWLKIQAPNGIWEKAGRKILNAIEAKGFTEDSVTDNSILYTSRYATLTISWTDSGTIDLRFAKVYPEAAAE